MKMASRRTDWTSPRAANFGEKENVLAVKVDNRTNYQERATGTGFEWNANDFNPDYGGINHRVWLHLTGQDLPDAAALLWAGDDRGLRLSGEHFDLAIARRMSRSNRRCITHRVTGRRSRLSAVVVDQGGMVRAKFDGDAVDMVAGEKTDLTATGPLKDAQFLERRESVSLRRLFSSDRG